MRRFVWTALAVSLTLAATIAAISLRPAEEASAEQSVSIRVWQTFANVPKSFEWKEGDPCRFPADSPADPDQNRQLILRNQDDKIVSVVELGEARLAAGDESGSWHCILTTSVSIPDTSFLAVYLDGDWLRAFTPETLKDGINLNLTKDS